MNRLAPVRALVVLAAISLILWFTPLRNTLYLALHQDGYTHILLIVPAAAALIFLDRRTLSTNPQWSAVGIALLAVALALGAIAKWGRINPPSDVRLAISMTGLVLWWIGSFVLCFGLKGLRSFLFPLLFLFWMVPMPAVVMNRTVGWLQQGSAATTQMLFEAARVPVSRRGVDLVIPGIEIEVASECSSIRSSVILVVTTMILAHLFLRSPRRKLLVVATAVPLSIAKNGLRIFIIAMIGTHFDPAFLTGWFHHHGGIFFFLIALAAICVLLWILRRGEERALQRRPLRLVNSA
ncbi:MAG TPA: exosortase/archaeosortase family protein [Candidatus Aquilonibacter sp.]|nr:exosortase/archaeosortase family protein [Candidatus Aquilonibacter sp.]